MLKQENLQRQIVDWWLLRAVSKAGGGGRTGEYGNDS